MAKYSRLKVLNCMIEKGMLPLFYDADPKVVICVIEACLDGGARCFEFTNRGDLAMDVYRDIAYYFRGDERLILGAGSVLDPATAALYLQLGANFIVGPVLNPEVARVCNRRKIAYLPGCGSVSEISQAEELGVEICKIFPGSAVGGPAFVKDVLGPLPWACLMPTGGVEPTQESIEAWFKAGAMCVGMGSKLFPKDLIVAGNFAGITENVRRTLGYVQAAHRRSI